MKLLTRWKNLQVLLVCLVFLTGFYSCDKKSISFGQNLAESYTHLVVIDTVTPYLATYKLDSFPTSNSGVALIGGYSDNVFGTVSSKSFFQFNPPATLPDIPEGAVFDSFTLIMKLNKGYYGDTSIPQQVNVNELSSPLQLPGNATSFYNTSTIAYKSDILGSKTIAIKPNVSDTVEIRLSADKGKDIFSKLVSKSTELTSAIFFQQYLKGLVIMPATSNPTAIYGVNTTDSSLKMRIYYREKDIVLANKYIDFPYAGNNTLQFNQITANRNNTVLNGLPNKNPEIESGKLLNAAYVQSATGLVAKIRFPSLRDLLLLNPYGKILRAILIIKPVSGSYNDIYRLPPQLTLVRTDQYNTIGAALTSSDGTTQYGNLSINNVDKAQTNYSFDVTTFLQGQIQTDINAQNGLLIYPPSPAYQTSLNRLVMGNSLNPNGQLQLKIYYLTVN